MPAMNSISGSGELLLYGEIGNWSDGLDPETVVRQLEQASGNIIKVRIHSGGGSVVDGLAIYNLLKHSKKSVHVYIDGLAASIASVIAMAGNKVFMPENAWLMIHSPWNSATGNAAAFRQIADSLDAFESNLITIYREKTGMAASKLKTMLEAETWINASEAKKLGFIDEIITSVKAAASIDLTALKNAPKQLIEDLQMPDTLNSDEQQTPEQARAEAKEAKAELKRVSEINKVGAMAKMPADMIEGFIADGTPIQDVRSKALDLIASREPRISSFPNAGGYEGSTSRVAHFAEALACRHSNLKPSDAARPYMGKSVADMARDLLEAAGIRTSFMSPQTVVAKAMHSTSDFPVLLADSSSRILRSAYDSQPGVMKKIGKVNKARDFRPLTSVRLGEAPTLLKINEGAEFQYGTMAESRETYSLGTYGRIFGITRQALINDDLGAFTDMSIQLGRSVAEFEAGFLLDKIVSNPKMADNKALFHADHNNIGTTGVLSEATLSEARKMMRKQTGLDGKTPIDARPKYLVIPAALETQAEKILSAIYAAKVSDANPFTNMLEILVEPRLDVVSETKWYLFSDPGILTVLEYAYLENNEGPMVETRPGWETDGVEFKVRLDIGAGILDHRGALMNAGV